MKLPLLHGLPKIVGDSLQIALRISIPASRSCKPKSSNKRRLPRVSASNCSWLRALRHSIRLMPTRLATRPQFRCSYALARAVAFVLPRSVTPTRAQWPPPHVHVITCNHAPTSKGDVFAAAAAGNLPALVAALGRGCSTEEATPVREASMHAVMLASSANFPVTLCTMRREQGGETALMIAASKGHAKIVGALVHAGANASSKTLASSARRLHVGRTAPCQVPVVLPMLLIPAGERDCTPPCCATRPLRDRSIPHGDPRSADQRAVTRACSKTLKRLFPHLLLLVVIQHRLPPPAPVLQGGWTPLHRAAAGNSVPVVRALLSADALQTNPALWVRDLQLPWHGTALSVYCASSPHVPFLAGWPHTIGHCPSEQE